MIITVKLRLKDKYNSWLNDQARAVNIVWNYCNEVQKKRLKEHKIFFNYYDFHSLTSGANRELNLLSSTIQKVCMEYDKSCKTHKPWNIKWRTRKSLGWVPFNTGDIKIKKNRFFFKKKELTFMHSPKYSLINSLPKAGSFNQDSKGRWYMNISLQIDQKDKKFYNAIGIDLGLKSFATLSNGHIIDNPKYYRKTEFLLALAQKANKKKKIKSIHMKIKNRRKDFLHKLSSNLVKEYGTIIVGNVSSSKLAKTKMAKSVNDTSWYSFKTMLAYKSIMNGGRMIEVNEAYSSVTCSSCLSRSGPKGIAELRVREWICDVCGSIHDRDHNAAQNILRIGLDTLVEGTS